MFFKWITMLRLQHGDAVTLREDIEDLEAWLERER